MANFFGKLFGTTYDRQALQILRIGFTVAPIIAGLDKFFDWLVNWDQYLAPQLVKLLGGSSGAHTFMSVVGIVEILAGVLVAFKPKIGGYVLTAWLLGIISNLVLSGKFYDVALRDLGLALGALAMARLATIYDNAAVIKTV